MRKIIACFVFVFPLFAYAQTPADCLGAVPICDTVFTLPYLPDEDNDFPNEINPTISCLNNGEVKGRWYKFASVNTGILSFTIIPADTTYDFDWSLFRMNSTPCPQIYGDTSLLVRCDFSGPNGTNGSTGADGLAGTGHQPVVNIASPSVYYLYVSSAAMGSSDTLGYTIDFSASTFAFGNCGEIGIEEVNAPGQFNVYPNPATDRIAVNLNCDQCESATFTLYDMNGRNIYSHIISSGSTEYLPVDHLPAGMYFYRVMQADGKVKGEKLILN